MNLILDFDQFIFVSYFEMVNETYSNIFILSALNQKSIIFMNIFIIFALNSSFYSILWQVVLHFNFSKLWYRFDKNQTINKWKVTLFNWPVKQKLPNAFLLQKSKQKKQNFTVEIIKLILNWTVNFFILAKWSHNNTESMWNEYILSHRLH